MKAFSVLFERCHGNSFQQKLHVFQFPKAANSFPFSSSHHPSLSPWVLSSYLSVLFFPPFVLPFVLKFSTLSSLTTKIFQLQEVTFRQKVSQTYSLLSRFLYSPFCLPIKDLIRRSCVWKQGWGFPLLVGHKTYYNGWCCGDMLIGSLPASAEQQSLTIRKNNDFTMMGPTLLTRGGRISMHCRSLEGSCRPWERALQLEVPPVSSKLSCCPSFSLFLLPEKEEWGDSERSGLVGGGGPVADLGHRIYRGDVRKKSSPA